MKNCVMPAMAVAIVMLTGLSAMAGYGANPAKRAATKPELYTVVQVGDEVKVVTKSELKGLPKSVRDEDQKRKKEYDDAKKMATKNKEKLDMPKPIPRKVTKLSLKDFKTQEEANDWANSWIEKHPQGNKPGGTKTAKKSAVY